MSAFTEEYIDSIVSKVATNAHLVQWEHTVRKFLNIGQNYFGVIIPITLSGTNDKGKAVNLPIVLKLAPIDERYRISGAVTLMFQREIYVYSVLFKKYRELQSNVAVSQFVIPSVYFLQDEYCKEVIAMQDMCGLGYKPYTHEAFLDLDHLSIALESLARLHALSFVLKKKDRQHYDEVIKVCIPLTDKSKRYMDILMDRLMKAKGKLEGTKYAPLLEKLNTNCGRLFDKAIELAQGMCISHGDVWKENILFKYDKSNKPVSACLIDYQTTRLASPAFDTLYLIIMSTDTNLRKNSYYMLLSIYYETFCDILLKFGLDPQLAYSREMLDHDLKVVAPACLVTANTALWLSNGLQEEGHVQSKHIWTLPEEKEMAVNTYKSTLKAIIDDFYCYGYLLREVIE